MKIAICFSGQPRFLDKLNISNLVLNHQFDIYAHFWWDKNYRGQKFAWNSLVEYPLDYDPVEYFKNKFSPKKLIYEPYPIFDMSLYKMVSRLEQPLSTDIVEQSIYRQKSQWTSIKKCFNLVEDDYDIVIRTRTDVEYRDKVDLEIVQANTLHIMDGSMQAGIGRQYSDWFYCGDKNIVKKFDMLKVYDIFYKDGIKHMHDLMQYALLTLEIPHTINNFNSWIMKRN